MTFFQPSKGGPRQGSKISKLKRSDLVSSRLVLSGLVCSGSGLAWSCLVWSALVWVWCGPGLCVSLFFACRSGLARFAAHNGLKPAFYLRHNVLDLPKMFFDKQGNRRGFCLDLPKVSFFFAGLI